MDIFSKYFYFMKLMDMLTFFIFLFYGCNGHVLTILILMDVLYLFNGCNGHILTLILLHFMRVMDILTIFLLYFPGVMEYSKYFIIWV